MIELPEALTLAHELSEAVSGETVAAVLPPTKPHKFCWFNGEAVDYENKIKGAKIVSAQGFGIYVEMSFDNGEKLCINDGVNVRLISSADVPKDYQLLIRLDGGDALVFTVAMYGGIVLHSGDYDNEYYLKSRAYISPFSSEFEKLFNDNLAAGNKSLSAKAFLATGQRFPGIGNGALQDILFAAGIHPKRKTVTLNEGEVRRLFGCTVSVLREMTEGGGRDTEKNIYGACGGYKTKMSKNTLAAGCPVCGGAVVKEAYLGGSVYYCPTCQPLEK